MDLHPAAARNSGTPQAFASGRYSWVEVWDQLRVAVLLAIGLDRAEVARKLNLSEADVRALGPNTSSRLMRRHLTRRAVNALLNGRHAHLGGRTVANRAKSLIKIASAHTVRSFKWTSVSEGLLQWRSSSGPNSGDVL